MCPFFELLILPLLLQPFPLLDVIVMLYELAENGADPTSQRASIQGIYPIDALAHKCLPKLGNVLRVCVYKAKSPVSYGTCLTAAYMAYTRDAVFIQSALNPLLKYRM